MLWQVVCHPSVRPSIVNNFGVATITQTNFIRSVSNFGNRKLPRKYRSSSNMIKISQSELGYLPLNFFNFTIFEVLQRELEQIFSDLFQTLEIGRSLGKYRSSLNMSKIGQPELGYLPLNFFNFPILQVLQRYLEQIYSDLFQTLEIGSSL